MKKLFLILLSFSALCVSAQNNIAGYEYWFNSNYSGRINQALTPAPEINLQTAISTTGLQDGLNFFHMHFYDDSMQFSSPISNFFYNTKGSLSDVNKISAYRYWFNTNILAADTVLLSAEVEADMSAEIDALGLIDGLNVFHIQLMDEQEIWSVPLSQYFYKTLGHYINAYQYWFNDDIASAVTDTIFPVQNAEIITPIDASGLNDGLNIFHFRVKDEQNLWSSAISQFIFKTNTQTSDSSRINEYQYWFNSDFASAITESISPVQDAEITTPIDASSLNNGLNIFHFRVKSEQNLWSSAISQFIFKTNTQTSDSSRINAYQYWFDNGFSSAVTENVSPMQDAFVVASVDAASLSDGIHTFYIRFLDESGLWSSTISSFFFKTPSSGSNAALIVEYSYWFDQNFADTVNVSLETPVNPHDLILSIDMTTMPAGYYNFNFRSKDTTGLWSVVITDNFYKNPFPISEFSANITEFCDSGYVQFTNTSMDGDVFLWDFDDGSNSAEFEPEHYFSNPGQYMVSLTATNTLTGLDSTTQMQITVHPSHELITDQHICSGDIFEWRGDFYDVSGIYMDSLNTVFGCDSVFVLNLYVEPHFQFVENEEICNGDIFSWRGNNYTSPGTYYDSLNSQYGCDSVYVLNLLVNPTYEFVQNEAICNGEQFSWRGDDYSVEGMYYDSLQTAQGCDSVYVLNLLVNPTYELVQNEAICIGEQFSWRGDDYSEEGTYYDSLQTIQGCDSVYVLNLLVNPTHELVNNEAICIGEQFSWRGADYSVEGMYYDSLQTAQGCDSVYVLNLLVNPTYEFVQNEAICNGEQFSWRGDDYSEEGIYYDSLFTVQGCDSVYVLNLLVHPTYELVQNEAICVGEQFSWRGDDYSEEGTYYDSLQTIQGCDSVYVLNLLVNPTYEFVQNEAICNGEQFSWRGADYSVEGTYYDSLQTAQGCDSVYVLNLLVNPTYEFVQNEAICNGEQFSWRGDDYSVEGTYYDSLQTVQGCDSVYVLNLIVHDLPNVSINGLDTFYCDYNPVVDMIGVPPGGVFSGQGVSGNQFNPGAAGLGTWEIIYNYIDTNGCANSDTIIVVVDDCVGVENSQLSSILIFPNPTDGNFLVDLGNDYKSVKLEITDITGREIKSEIVRNKQILSVSITDPPGIYLIKISIDKKETVIKLIKQ